MQATGKGQNVVETFNLQGQGLYPLSEQGKQALLNAVNQTLTSQGTSVANITLGQVTVRVVRHPLLVQCLMLRAANLQLCVVYFSGSG